MTCVGKSTWIKPKSAIRPVSCLVVNTWKPKSTVDFLLCNSGSNVNIAEQLKALGVGCCPDLKNQHLDFCSCTDNGCNLGVTHGFLLSTAFG